MRLLTHRARAAAYLRHLTTTYRHIELRITKDSLNILLHLIPDIPLAAPALL